MADAVFTIGHSNYPVERLFHLFLMHSISAVCDVRSQPYSRVNPQFNREPLKAALRVANIKYVFLGAELGARSSDRSCYRNGQVQYDLLAKTDLFRRGIDRVKEGAKSFRLALLCAEKEPLDCHRTLLVSKVLYDEGLAVHHILSDGRIEEHARTIERLVAMSKVPGSDLFRHCETVVQDAYRQRSAEIAYRENTTNDHGTDNALGHAIGNR